MNSSNAAISVVQAPDSCSSMPFSAFSGNSVAHWTDDALTIFSRRRLRIDFDCIEALRRLGMAVMRLPIFDLEDLPDIRCWVGADQQDLLSRVGEAKRGGARQRRLADAALAGEENEFGQALRT